MQQTSKSPRLGERKTRAAPVRVSAIHGGTPANISAKDTRIRSPDGSTTNIQRNGLGTPDLDGTLRSDTQAKVVPHERFSNYLADLVSVSSKGNAAKTADGHLMLGCSRGAGSESGRDSSPTRGSADSRKCSPVGVSTRRAKGSPGSMALQDTVYGALLDEALSDRRASPRVARSEDPVAVLPDHVTQLQCNAAGGQVMMMSRCFTRSTLLRAYVT